MHTAAWNRLVKREARQDEEGASHRHELLQVRKVHVQDKVQVHALPEVQARLLRQTICCGHCDATGVRTPALAAMRLCSRGAANEGDSKFRA